MNRNLSLKIVDPIAPNIKKTVLETAFRDAFFARYNLMVDAKYDTGTNTMIILAVEGKRPNKFTPDKDEFIAGFCAAVYICRCIDNGATWRQE